MGPCTEWSAWGEWSQCSVTSGKGSKKRTKTCIRGLCSEPAPIEVGIGYSYTIQDYKFYLKGLCL